MYAIRRTICSILFVFLSTSANELDNRVKRMDVNTCFSNFDVKHDIIIRSEESVRMGAKFLATSELNSQNECAQFCCRTENCDVYVFQEKSVRTCFLFQCGPAQNFRCKFNKHENYTSAVLSVHSRTVPPTVAPVKAKNVHPTTLSQNEIDLKLLKEKALGVKKEISPSSTTTTTAMAPAEKALLTAGKKSTSHCGRFEFQCHSGDCIAVYNACDGIPQCDDGSDEGPECQSVTRSPDTSSNKLDSRIQSLNSNMHINDYKIAGHSREDSSKLWPNSNHITNNGLQYSKGGEILPNTQLEQSFIPQYQQSQQSIQPLPQIFPANALPASSIQSWNTVADPNLLSKWPQQMPQFPMKSYQPYGQYQPDSNQLQNAPFTWPIVSETQSNGIQQNPNTEELLPDKNTILKDVVVADRKKDGRNTLPETDKLPASTESSEYKYEDDDEQATTEPPKKKKKHRKVNKVDKPSNDETSTVDDTVEQQMKIIHEKLQAEYVEHDGAADRPSGAVISLAMGILITIGLILMFGCQSKNLRRRVRRGKGYAADSDFLVNGMYL